MSAARENIPEFDETRFKLLVQQTPFFAIEVMRVMVHRLRHLDAQV